METIRLFNPAGKLLTSFNKTALLWQKIEAFLADALNLAEPAILECGEIQNIHSGEFAEVAFIGSKVIAIIDEELPNGSREGWVFTQADSAVPATFHNWEK